MVISELISQFDPVVEPSYEQYSPTALVHEEVLGIFHAIMIHREPITITIEPFRTANRSL